MAGVPLPSEIVLAADRALGPSFRFASQLLVAAARELYRTDPSKPGLLFPVAEPVPSSSKALQFNDGYSDRVGESRSPAAPRGRGR